MKTIANLTVVACVLSLAFGFKLRPRPEGRIVGGETVNIEKVPYHLGFLYYNGYTCGASLISAKSVLTAAFCTTAANSNLNVGAGATINGFYVEVVNVTEIHQHPMYDVQTNNYDISVLILKWEFTLGAKVGVVALQPINVEPAVGTPAVVTGWGAMAENEVVTLNLRKVTVSNVPREECNVAYDGKITAQMICYEGPGKGFCMSDYGGPLVNDGKQVGIISWGEGCARPGLPGVYTNIADSEIHEFITSETSDATRIFNQQLTYLALFFGLIIFNRTRIF